MSHKAQKTAQHATDLESDYFADAKDWAYERYKIQEVMANRWQLAFWVAMGFGVLLVVLLVMLLPLKSWQPIVIRHNTQTGEVFVDQTHMDYLPNTSSEVQSDLMRYVVARETYSAVDSQLRRVQVRDSSSPSVAKSYVQLQDRNNPNSPFVLYGSHGLRTVKVEDIVFLDGIGSSRHEKKKQHRTHVPTLAKVDFKTTETKRQTTITRYWVATIQFQYLGTPAEKEAAWLNWNGFTVTSYRVDQRNI